jgi:hypothetical protein
VEDHERLMAAQLKVIAPLVVLHGLDERHHYLYSGAVVVPEAYDRDQIKSLIEEGQLGSEGERVAALADEPPHEEKPDAPSGNASLEAWQDYAKSQGASDDDLEGLSRNDLRDKYSD